MGDVLVEQTVSKVLPEVEKNHANLKGIVENGRQQLQSKTKEIQEYKKKWNITIKDKDNDAGSKVSNGGNDDKKEKQQQGVLVA